MTSPLNMALGILGVVGSTCALFGLPGAYARVAREGGLAWLLGCLFLAVTGLVFGVFMGLTGVVVFSALATSAPTLFQEGPPPSFFPVFIVGTLANVVGPVLMALPIIRKRIYPRWTGYVLLAGAVLAVLSIFSSGPGPQGVLSQIVSTVSPLPLFLAVGWMGYLLWTESSSLAGAPARSANRIFTPLPATSGDLNLTRT